MIDTIKIFLTYKCNFNCDYCFVTHSDEVMKPEVLDKILNWAIDNRIKEIILTGGEPTLCFNLIRQAAEFVNLKAPYMVFDDIPTNGSQLTFDNIIEAKKLGLKFAFSLDGFSFEKNKFRNSDKETYKKVIKNIAFYTKEYNELPRIKLTVNLNNAKYLHENVKSLLKKGLKNIQILPAFSVEWSDDKTQEFLESYDKLLNLYNDMKKKDDEVKVDPISWYLESIKRKNFKEIEKNHCNLGKDVCFSPLGEAYSCLAMIHLRNNEELRKKYFLGNINTFIDLKKLKIIESYRICKDIGFNCDYCFPLISCKKLYSMMNLKKGKNLDVKYAKNFIKIENEMFFKVYRKYKAKELLF